MVVTFGEDARLASVSKQGQVDLHQSISLIQLRNKRFKYSYISSLSN